MAIHKFPGFTDKALTLTTFSTHLGTGGVKARVAVMDALDDEYFDMMDNDGVLHDISGCIDAPELLPSGGLARAPHRPKFNVSTEPRTIARG